MKKTLLLSLLIVLIISCNNLSNKKIVGSKTQENFISFVFKNYPLSSKNKIDELEQNKIFDKKLKQYVYDSLQNIDGFLMKIKKIDLQQLDNEKRIQVVLVDYKSHLLDVDYYASNSISSNKENSTSVLYRNFIDKKLNDYVFVYGKLDTMYTFYGGFNEKAYKIDIDSTILVEKPKLISQKNKEHFY